MAWFVWRGQEAIQSGRRRQGASSGGTVAAWERVASGRQFFFRGGQGCEGLGELRVEERTIPAGAFSQRRLDNWVFHMRWSYKPDALLEIWQDGKLVLTHPGPNCYNDPNGPYFKIGIYHPAWKDFEAETFNAQKVIIPRKVIFHDEVRVVADGKYEDVAPRP